MQQPKVFVGRRSELVNLAHVHMWDVNKVRLVNGVEQAYRLRGLSLTKDDIFYGQTICTFPSGVAFHICEEIQFLLRK